MYASAVGIDLGTTNTAVAILTDGSPDIIVNKQGERLTPSVVFYNPNNLSCCVGTVAQNQAIFNLPNFCFGR